MDYFRAIFATPKPLAKSTLSSSKNSHDEETALGKSFSAPRTPSARSSPYVKPTATERRLLAKQRIDADSNNRIMDMLFRSSTQDKETTIQAEEPAIVEAATEIPSSNGLKSERSPFVVPESRSSEANRQIASQQPFDGMSSSSSSPPEHSNSRLIDFLYSKRGQPLTDSEINACKTMLEPTSGSTTPSVRESRSGSISSRPFFAPVRSFKLSSSSMSSTRNVMSKVRISRKPVQYVGSGFGASVQSRRGGSHSMWGHSSSFVGRGSSAGSINGAGPRFKPRPKALAAEATQETSLLATKRIKFSSPESVKPIGSLASTDKPQQQSTSNSRNVEAKEHKQDAGKKGRASVAQAILSSLDDIEPPPTNLLMPFGMMRSLPNPYLSHQNPSEDKAQGKMSPNPSRVRFDLLEEPEKNKHSIVDAVKEQPTALPFSAREFNIPAVSLVKQSSIESAPKSEFTFESKPLVPLKHSEPASSTNNGSSITSPKPGAALLVVDTPISFETTDSNKPNTKPSFSFNSPPTPAPISNGLPLHTEKAITQTTESIVKKVLSMPLKDLPKYSFDTKEHANKGSVPTAISIEKVILEYAERGLITKTFSLAPIKDLPAFEFDGKVTISTPMALVATALIWECNICLIKNSGDKQICAACESPKPSSVVNKPSTQSPVVSWPAPSAKSKTASATGNWECNICLVKNPGDKKICIACETPK